MSAHDTYESLRDATEFTVTDEHLKLMRRAYVGWDYGEFGAPAIDCKRPYGNSDVVGDIAEILGIETNDDEEFPEDVQERLTALHGETATALQIALSTGEFKAGRYARERYGDWLPASE